MSAWRRNTAPHFQLDEEDAEEEEEERRRGQERRGLTGVGGVVLGVLQQLVDVHLHPRLGGALHQTVDVLPRQSQRQTLTATTHWLVIQNGRWKEKGWEVRMDDLTNGLMETIFLLLSSAGTFLCISILCLSADTLTASRIFIQLWRRANTPDNRFIVSTVFLDKTRVFRILWLEDKWAETGLKTSCWRYMMRN